MADAPKGKQPAPTIPLGKQAVFWIMQAPKGTVRTQQQAAKKFGIKQAVVSLAMKKYVTPSLRPDGRRRRKEA